MTRRTLHVLTLHDWVRINPVSGASWRRSSTMTKLALGGRPYFSCSGWRSGSTGR